MRIERYYSSVKEESSPLADDAMTLLDAEDYVGFFKACGPNYVRSIRRAQEITAIFKFSSSSTQTAKEFAGGLKVSGWGQRASMEFSAKSKFNSINSSLEIKIFGYGLGLSQEGSETLVATSLDQYNEVMKFAFTSMTKNEDAHHIGMVYGMEVVPWVHNSAFQVAAKMQDENIVIPLPRSLIPRAYKRGTEFVTDGFANDDATRELFTCKGGAGFEIDRYGYCCEIEALYDYTEGQYDPVNATERICKPVRNLDRSLVKDNMANNGEFVSRLDASMRYRLTQLGVGEKCISAAHAIPNRFNYHYLKKNDGVKYDRAIDIPFTLMDLKNAVDPFHDYGIIKHLAVELDEWIEKFYSPCFAALYGTNIGTTPDVDMSYFMAYPWHTHKECMHLACLAPNMRWNRNGGGCVPGIATGSTSPGYEENEDGDCATDVESDAATEECKHDQGKLGDDHTDYTDCWKKNTVGSGSITYFIENFCNPQLIGTSMTDEEATTFYSDKTCTKSGSRRRLIEVVDDAQVTLNETAEAEEFVGRVDMEAELIAEPVATKGNPVVGGTLNLKRKLTVEANVGDNESVTNLKKRMQDS